MQNDGPQLHRREKIATTEEESILTIDRLDSIDAANYSCRVANEAGEDRLAVQLVVKTASKLANFTTEQHFNLGQKFKFFCYLSFRQQSP
ncbi:hypothetical protein TYRP_004119 [Tyrophagus putrescentiae]|nr:hypothetical protein TYRP_004119 [Tyrophagus putrescentiae]